jgi:hypothetical protein
LSIDIIGRARLPPSRNAVLRRLLPVADDPHEFGRITVANALSDVDAMAAKLGAVNVLAAAEIGEIIPDPEKCRIRVTME